MTFLKAAKKEELWNGEMKGVLLNGQPVLLVHVEGKIYAYEDRCAHQGVPLSEGKLEGKRLICRAHHWEYDIGEGMGSNPLGARLRSYAVKLEGEEIWVDLEQRGETHGRK